MNYKETTSWMFSKLPMYQSHGKSAYKEDLHRTELLVSHLKNPHHNFKSVHVGGTNGKGSTCHMIASVLQNSGYKVGLYTSPHLKDFRERIRINGNKISKKNVVNFIHENKSFLELNKLSFFEMTVGMAFDFFSEEQVDIAIIEVGLGGRLDSTNVIMPLLSIITNIGMDHTQFLGDTLQKIAFEKAGIIKYNTPVVIGEFQEDIVHVFNEKASKMNSQISFANQLIRNPIECSLKGSYQKSNVKTAQLALNILISKGFNISKSSLKLGFSNVQKSTGIKGRWQILGTQPKIICDTAHNKDGLSLVFNQLARENFNNLHVVLGFVNDKSLESIITIFPVNAQYYFCRPNIARGLDSSELKKLFLRNNLKGKSYSSVTKAFSEAKASAKKNDLIFVGGSTFVVAEVV